MPLSSRLDLSSEDVPTVAFCDLVKNPSPYFDKLIRLTAVFGQAEEAQYLSHDECLLSHDNQIGVGYVTQNKQASDEFNKNITLIGSPEYGGKALVTVVGMLRDSSRRDFAWYRYRFDIVRFESVSHLTVPYGGDLQAGTSYVGLARADSSFGLSLTIPVRMPMHYAVRVEWINLAEFPELKAAAGNSTDHQIVFSVLSDEMKQITANRWNRTIRCKIVQVVN
ncbi:MAG TPA: hypothetical protein VEZ90_09740 [Blastocatellia bacterium]|nr:hypothetical protein [Blastocatellia bacterium]